MTNTISHVLVTGGAGFIGVNLIRLLLDDGRRVSVVDVEPPSTLLTKLGPSGSDVTYHRVDILDREALSISLRDVDGVVHLAGDPGVPESVEDPVGNCEINVGGTLNVLEAARVNGVKRFVFASSNAALGRQEPPAREVLAPLPISPYGAAKLAGEAYCMAYDGSYGLGTISLRFANVYGPHSGQKTSVVAKFIRNLMTGHSLVLYGDGRQTRDFIYVEDLCGAIISSLDSQISGEVINIATGEETSVRRVAEQISSLAGTKLDIDSAPPRTGDVRVNYSDVTKAKSALGWTAHTSIDSGLKVTWDWFAANLETTGQGTPS
jgi:UDP-glucose 4-epimerase